MHSQNNANIFLNYSAICYSAILELVMFLFAQVRMQNIFKETFRILNESRRNSLFHENHNLFIKMDFCVKMLS